MPGPLTGPHGAPERLSPVALAEAQRETLAAPRRQYTLAARSLFAVLGLVYGRRRNLAKFRVLELIARVPYQAWEQVAYVAITHTGKKAGFARRIHDRVIESRAQQDNEQWHLFILTELIESRGEGSN